MQLQLKRSQCPYLDTVVQDLRNQELTQEIRLSEGMPDIGRVLCAWGQPVLRGKEWRSDRVSFSGGLMLWVLYVPQEGGKEHWVEGWIPFQMEWDLPRDCPDGRLRIRCLTRFVDARGISARKLMVRAGIAVRAEAFVPNQAETVTPEKIPEQLQMCIRRWPLRLQVEAGETHLDLEEQLNLPEADFRPEAVLCCRLDPAVTESRVVGNKLVFRGNGNLHLICRSTQGKLRGFDFPMPFSQFAELDRDYGPEAAGDLTLSPTALETEVDEAGRISVRCGMAAQYLLTDRILLELGEDAYIPGREAQIHREDLELPVVLENRRENIYGEQTISADGADLVDLQLIPEFPRQRRSGDEVELTMPGQVQALYYGPDGMLNAASSRWEGKLNLRSGDGTMLNANPLAAQQPRAHMSGNGIALSWELPVELTTSGRQQMPMVTDVVPGQPIPKDPDRPSLILRRAGEQRLWDIARSADTTEDAIRRANNLTEEPTPEQILLIPVL